MSSLCSDLVHFHAVQTAYETVLLSFMKSTSDDARSQHLTNKLQSIRPCPHTSRDLDYILDIYKQCITIPDAQLPAEFIAKHRERIRKFRENLEEEYNHIAARLRNLQDKIHRWNGYVTIIGCDDRTLRYLVKLDTQEKDWDVFYKRVRLSLEHLASKRRNWSYLISLCPAVSEDQKKEEIQHQQWHEAMDVKRLQYRSGTFDHDPSFTYTSSSSSFETCPSQDCSSSNPQPPCAFPSCSCSASTIPCEEHNETISGCASTSSPIPLPRIQLCDPNDTLFWPHTGWSPYAPQSDRKVPPRASSEQPDCFFSSNPDHSSSGHEVLIRLGNSRSKKKSVIRKERLRRLQKKRQQRRSDGTAPTTEHKTTTALSHSLPHNHPHTTLPLHCLSSSEESSATDKKLHLCGDGSTNLKKNQRHKRSKNKHTKPAGHPSCKTSVYNPDDFHFGDVDTSSASASTTRHSAKNLDKYLFHDMMLLLASSGAFQRDITRSEPREYGWTTVVRPSISKRAYKQ